MAYFKIVNIILETGEAPACYRAFRLPDSAKEKMALPEAGSLRVDYRPGQELVSPAEAVTTVSGLNIGRAGNGWVYEDSRTGCIMYTDGEYSHAVLSEEVKEHAPLWGFLLQLLIECRLLDMGVLTLHSSCIESRGKAFAFSGPSGCGKSTRAYEWVKANGAEFVSGDRPAVDVEGRTVFGIPWDGKEQIFKNVSVPLGAVFEVRRAPFTRIRKLSPAQARDFLVRQIFIPMWDPERAMKAMILLRRFAGSAGIYRLFCSNDRQAAQETGQIIFDERKKILEESTDMKLKEGFVLKSMAGENIIMPTGGNIAAFNGTVILNDVSAFIIKQMENGGVSRDDLLELILKEYTVDRETAAADLDELTAKLKEMGVVSE